MVGSTPQRSINRPRRTDTSSSNMLDNKTYVIEICPKLATEQDGGLFEIRVTLACLQQAGTLPRRTRHWTTTQRRDHNIVHLKDATIRVKVQQETPDLIWTDGNGDRTRRWMASERQINSLSWRLAVIIIRQQISLTNRLAYQSTNPANKLGNDELEPNTADLREDHHLWGD